MSESGLRLKPGCNPQDRHGVGGEFLSFCSSKMDKVTAEVNMCVAQCTEAPQEFHQLSPQNIWKTAFLRASTVCFHALEMLASAEVRLALASLRPGNQRGAKHLLLSLFLSQPETAVLIMIFVSQPSGTLCTCLCVFRELEQHTASLQHCLLWVPSCHQRCDHKWK